MQQQQQDRLQVISENHQPYEVEQHMLQDTNACKKSIAGPS